MLQGDRSPAEAIQTGLASVPDLWPLADEWLEPVWPFTPREGAWATQEDQGFETPSFLPLLPAGRPPMPPLPLQFQDLGLRDISSGVSQFQTPSGKTHVAPVPGGEFNRPLPAPL